MARVWSSNAFDIDKYDFHSFVLDFTDAGAIEVEHSTPTTIKGVTYSSWMDFSFGERRVILARRQPDVRRPYGRFLDDHRDDPGHHRLGHR